MAKGDEYWQSSLLLHLEQMILLGQPEAIIDYLANIRVLMGQEPAKLHSIYLKLLWSLFTTSSETWDSPTGNGSPRAELSALLDLTKLLYGDDIRKFLMDKFENFIEVSAQLENTYRLKLQMFTEIFQKLKIQYHCQVCETTFNSPVGLLFCQTCENFMCNGGFFGGPPSSDCNFTSEMCQPCRQKSLQARGVATCSICRGDYPISFFEPCPRCNDSFCQDCIPRIDPELLTASNHFANPQGGVYQRLCDNCYMEIYTQQCVDLGICSGCSHGVHVGFPCAARDCQCDLSE